MKIAFYTLGCKVNQYDTQAMIEIMEAAGYTIVDFDEAADVYIINTCTVTAVADKKSRQMISRARERSPFAKIIVAGCYSQRAPEEVLAIDGVSLVCGTTDRKHILQLVEGLFQAENKQQNVVSDNHRLVFEDTTATRESRTRAHLKIQDGCDRYCTYCAIPYVRGNIRSRTLKSIRQELIKLENEGFHEVVFTGIHLMSYGNDLPDRPNLLDAIRMADGLNGIKRIRLGSLEPQLLTDEYVTAFANNEKICRQFHLSLQSGSKSVLARMGRRYTPSDYESCVDILRKAMPGCAITTDIIVGFPGESEDEFLETLKFVQRIRFSKIHAFPYSRRSGTVAADFPNQIKNSVKSQRNAELIKLGRELEREYQHLTLGTEQEVLIETSENGVVFGHTGEYLYVHADYHGDASLVNTFATVKIYGFDGEILVGKIV